MTSTDLLFHVREIIAVTNPQTPLNRLLDIFSQALNESVAQVGKAIVGRSSNVMSVNGAVDGLVKLLDEVGIKARTGRLMAIFDEANIVQEKLNNFLTLETLSGVLPLPNTVALIDRFTTDLENYWRNHKTEDVYTLLVSSSRLLVEFQTLRAAAQVLSRVLTPIPVEPKEGEEKLSLRLASDPSLDDFGKKLSALAGLYSEFCQLMEISEAQFPLRIVKVESGSLLALLIGSAVAMTAMRDAIFNAASFLYRNFTREGQKAQIPRDLEQAAAVLRLADQLKERNVDVAPIMDQLNKATIGIANRLNVLLADEEAVEVDGAVHPITPEAQQKLLAGKSILTIKDRAPNQEA